MSCLCDVYVSAMVQLVTRMFDRVGSGVGRVPSEDAEVPPRRAKHRPGPPR